MANGKGVPLLMSRAGGARDRLPSRSYPCEMWQIRTGRPRTTAPGSQMDLERAGLAWACPFSSSDEFEAAVISSRRRAGAYGPSRGRRLARGAVCVVAAIIATGTLYFLI